MAKVKYMGPSPAEVFPQSFLITDETGTIVEASRYATYNRGVEEPLPEPVDKNLATFLKLDESAVEIVATKAEIKAASKNLSGRALKKIEKRFNLKLMKEED